LKNVEREFIIIVGALGLATHNDIIIHHFSIRK